MSLETVEENLMILDYNLTLKQLKDLHHCTHQYDAIIPVPSCSLTGDLTGIIVSTGACSNHFR